MPTITLEGLRIAAQERPPGYEQTCISMGRIEGGSLILSEEAFDALSAHYEHGVPLPIRRATSADLPSLSVMAKNAAAAVAQEVKAVAADEPPVDPKEVERRLDLCVRCEHFLEAQKRCVKCGCYMKFKARLRSQHCPVGKW